MEQMVDKCLANHWCWWLETSDNTEHCKSQQ